ncbi:hypothetical protein [Effusibacillus pohliae]|uniref:hypothetical protein n=1 Tax=Effusibacillus pohliae TaxID=232270 RepID=UPI0003608872|nr:hypothetical protein [Effusibacillus pohliae]
MFKKFLLSAAFLIALFGQQTAQAAEMHDLELFDVTKGKVVQHMLNTEEIQQEARLWLQSVTGLAPEAKLEFRDGLILKVPLTPPVHAGNVTISRLFVIFRPAKDPLLLLLTEDNRPLLIRFDPGRPPLLSTLQQYCSIPLLYDLR